MNAYNKDWTVLLFSCGNQETKSRTLLQELITSYNHDSTAMRDETAARRDLTTIRCRRQSNDRRIAANGSSSGVEF